MSSFWAEGLVEKGWGEEVKGNALDLAFRGGILSFSLLINF